MIEINQRGILKKNYLFLMMILVKHKYERRVPFIPGLMNSVSADKI